MGFLIGGYCVYWKIKTRPMCEECQLFFGKTIKKILLFSNIEEVLQQCFLILSNINQYNFTETQTRNIDKKNFRLNILISTCISCKNQLLILTVEVRNGDSWENIEELGIKKILSKQEFIVGFS